MNFQDVKNKPAVLRIKNAVFSLDKNMICSAQPYTQAVLLDLDAYKNAAKHGAALIEDQDKAIAYLTDLLTSFHAAHQAALGWK